MTIKTIKTTMLIILCCCVSPTIIHGGEVDFKEHILITGNWGNEDGEFGKEELGKTELGYALDFIIYNNRVHILDAINNRIQVFSLDGKFLNKISLDFDWLKQGIAWEFTVLKEHYFLLVARPPYYSPLNIDNIYKFTSNGKLLNIFGIKQINKNREEYFSKIISSEKIGEIFCSVGGSSKIAEFDFDGNFIKFITNVKNHPQIILDNSGQIVKDAPANYSWLDKSGNYYRIKSFSSRKDNFAITTKIQIYNPSNGKTINHEIAGDVKAVENGKARLIKYSGNFTEWSYVDLDSHIYHFIALNDGVVLRRIE